MTRTEEVAAEALDILQELLDSNVFEALFSYWADWGTDQNEDTNDVEALKKRTLALLPQGKRIKR